MGKINVWRLRLRQLRRLALGVTASLVVFALFVVSLRYLGGETIAAVGALGDDKHTVLFGVATVALTLVGLLLAFVAVFGWASIREKVEFEVGRAMDGERRFDLALEHFGLGAVYGILAEFHLSKQSPTFFLEHAIQQSHRALSLVEEGSELCWKVKNNLACQLALRGRREDGERAIELAWEVWEFGGNVNGIRDHSALTLARVNAVFAPLVELYPKASLSRVSAILEAQFATGGRDEFTTKELESCRQALDGALALVKENPEPSHEELGVLIRKIGLVLKSRLLPKG